MKLETFAVAGAVVLLLAGSAGASQSGSPAASSPTTNQTGGNAAVGDPATHGTTDLAGQTPEPIGTGGTAVDQGKGGTGKPTNGTSDKKGKRKPKHGTQSKGTAKSAR